MYTIKMGPKMSAILDALQRKVRNGNANAEEHALYRKLGKTLKLLSENPRHPGLSSHKIRALQSLYHKDIWESYVENHTPGARRVFWCYGPEQQEITLISMELHPKDAKLPYQQIALEAKKTELFPLDGN